MDGRPAGSTHLRRIAAVIAGCAIAFGGVRAELLSSYFPAGVPGYGTAPGVTVASRERPDFDPLGFRLGGFVLKPQLTEGLAYDNNVFGGTDRIGSWILGTHPSLLVNSNWSRDSLGGYLGVDDLRYLDQPQQSRTDWTASVGGTLAVGPRSAFASRRASRSAPGPHPARRAADGHARCISGERPARRLQRRTESDFDRAGPRVVNVSLR